MSEVKTPEVLRSEIDTDVQDLSAQLKGQISVSHETGEVSFDDDYVDLLLGDVVTPEQKTKIDKRVVLGANATHLAVGELALDAFKANKDLTRVNGSTTVGGQHIEANISREGTVRNVASGEVTNVHLNGATKVVYKSPTSKAGFKRVRSYLQSIGEQELG